MMTNENVPSLTTAPAPLAAMNVRDAGHHGGNTATIAPLSFGVPALILPARPTTQMRRQRKIGNLRIVESHVRFRSNSTKDFGYLNNKTIKNRKL
jgi:xanthine dehydrogenase iron-sulfur cluster and FAD-binding subunit A